MDCMLKLNDLAHMRLSSMYNSLESKGGLSKCQAKV